ncbi:MAG: hypothetical protein L3K14_07740 [Thermoplasmata archaeon]|nr:hypothetical protein [Thermoplasmata archaeon]
MTGRWPLAVLGIAILLAASLPEAIPPGPTAAVSIYNRDPGLTGPDNGPIWNPNYLPGFNSSLPARIQWSAPTGGPGVVDYLVGPLSSPPSTALAPHFAVGPQVFGFTEVPRTQVFREPSWGDYNQVQSGFVPCAVTVGNTTLTPTEAVVPQYVGLPESAGDWRIDFSLDWSAPAPLPGLPAWGFVGLVATTTLPPLSTGGGARLVGTELGLWTGNSVAPGATSGIGVDIGGGIVGDVIFPIDQLPNGNVSRSYSIDLSPLLSKTFTTLGVSGAGGVLSYTYFLVAGYNYHVRVAIHNLLVQGPSSLCSGPGLPLITLVLVVMVPLSAWLVATTVWTRPE